MEQLQLQPQPQPQLHSKTKSSSPNRSCLQGGSRRPGRRFGDVAVEQRGSGLERRGWEVCRGAVGRLVASADVREVGVVQKLGEVVVVAVVNVVESIDEGCAGVVSGDVAGSGGNDQGTTGWWESHR
jgi:hypothetical protein